MSILSITCPPDMKMSPVTRPEYGDEGQVMRASDLVVGGNYQRVRYHILGSIFGDKFTVLEPVTDQSDIVKVKVNGNRSGIGETLLRLSDLGLVPYRTNGLSRWNPNNYVRVCDN